MLTIAYLIVETWRALWKPRATVVRKSSFRTTLQKSERPVLPTRRAREQASPTAESTELLNQQRFSFSCEDLSPEPKSPNSPKSPRQQQQRSPLQEQASPSDVLGVGDSRKVIARGIPVPAKQVVPSYSKPIHSEIPVQTSSVSQATPPSSIPIPQQSQQQQQQPQQQQQQPQQQQQQQPPSQPSHIPTPVQKSVKSLVLEPSVSGNRMDETWAKKQLDKFSFGFDEADKDKSGNLSFDEVCAVLKGHGFNGSRTEAQFIFGHMDKDGNKSVSRDEFSAAMRKIPRAAIREYVYRKAFKQMDKDNSGFLTKTEIEDATKNEGGIEIGSKAIGDLLCYISKDDDEKVNYEEFLRVFGIRSSGETMRKIFKGLDTDGSGFLTRNEMLDAVSNESELKLRASRISQLLIDLVKDEDKKMSYEEFLQSWFKQ